MPKNKQLPIDYISVLVKLGKQERELSKKNEPDHDNKRKKEEPVDGSLNESIYHSENELTEKCISYHSDQNQSDPDHSDQNYSDDDIDHSKRKRSKNILIKKSKRVFTKEQVLRLKRKFSKERNPIKEVQESYASMFGVTTHQIAIWYKNRRVKFRSTKRLRMCTRKNIPNDYLD